MPIETNRILVKMRPSGALKAAESRVSLRPLYDSPEATAAITFGVDATPQWFIAEMPEAAAAPWDLAHSRVADQLGVSESDVLFAEPDIIHDVYEDTNEERTAEGFGATKIECVQNPQDANGGKAVGTNGIWHLGDDFTQLGSARDAVAFSDPRTRIAHIDTGYYAPHVTRPAHLRDDLQRNFVEGDGNPNSAVDPNNERRLLDNSGHGTGTLSILAGQGFPPFNVVLGGAPGADIVPIRVADSVVLLRTSALARALAYAVEQQCDVISMSMGGVPTRAWAEAVDRLYEAGIVFCAAGGNRVRPTPPSVMVYPARYPRVIAVVGVMADGRPYQNLGSRVMEGSFGPRDAMDTALAAYTPNIPWARFGCDTVVRLNGEGTSSATPQVAAAAALWIEKNKKVLPRNWRRVEAVRKALFDKARKGNRDHVGQGVLQARAALDVAPDLVDVRMSGKSSNSFALLRLITGLGITEPTPREEMFNLELAQRWLKNPRLAELIEDPEFRARFDDEEQQRRAMQIVIEDEQASLALRRHVAARYPVASKGQLPPSMPNVVPDVLAACDMPRAPRNPPHRRLRVYAVDPSLSTRLSTASINEVTLKIPWDDFKDGAGEYLKFDDVDPKGNAYGPVDLNAASLLAQDGWAPAEGNAHFHQQMVYAVAMKTIAHFEKALGRPVFWRAKQVKGEEFVQHLTVRPHALRQANAFYSPGEWALKFGYFEATADHPGEHMPGSRVYTCLSHDIIAHETTHAILDGMHRRFTEATNPDVLAFHEAFADIVALLQHFTMRELLENEIGRTRGDLEQESMLGMLAVQFGQAMGGRGALRNAIGRFVNGEWIRNKPNPADLQERLTPHGRGAILVAAVFDAFIAIYKMRSADLLRIYTGGTGVLPTGAIHPDLVRRLANEAALAAEQVLEMCIRALDYLPPIDVTFFEYLRALITADAETDREGHEYRVALIEAFRRRGIYPQDLDSTDAPRTLSVDTLRWTGGINFSAFSDEERQAIRTCYDAIIRKLKEYAQEVLYLDTRKEYFDTTREHQAILHQQLRVAFQKVPAFANQLGLEFDDGFDQSDKFEVHSLRASMRTTKDGRHIPQVVVVLTQSKLIEGDAAAGQRLPKFRGGATLVVKLTAAGTEAVKYKIIKSLGSARRQQRITSFVQSAMTDPLRALLIAPSGDESFQALHSLADEGV